MRRSQPSNRSMDDKSTDSAREMVAQAQKIVAPQEELWSLFPFPCRVTQA
jgi:hypothetical protein